MGETKDKRNPSFEAFLETIMDDAREVNKASAAIGSEHVLSSSSDQWKHYHKALDRLQNNLKEGQKNGGGKHAVKNCICEFIYEEDGDGDKLPLTIKAIRLRGWVEVTPAAEGPFSSVSSSSSSKGGGG